MANKLIHKRSSVITDNNPKLPQPDSLEYGEIAINYADGYETITFKNTENEIVEVRTKEYFEDIIDKNEEAVSKSLNDLNTCVDETENAYAAADDALKVYVEGLIDGLDIPTNLSELTNDVPFVTQGEFNSLYNSMESKQDVITDLATIRSGAALGATALQSVPAEYVTEMELANKNYVTSAYVIGELNSKSDTGHTHSEYLTESELSNVATSGSYNDLTDKPVIPSIDGLATVTYVNQEIGKIQNSSYDDTEIKNQLANKADKSELFSKSYNDLTDKPTIPSVDGLASEEFVREEIEAIDYVTAVDTTETADGVSNDFVTSEQLDGRDYATNSNVNSQINTVNQSITTLNTTVGTNNSGKNLIERVTQLENGIGVPDARAKVLWLGTSIPAGDPNNNYPSMVGEVLGFEIHNMAQAASCLHWDPTPPTWTTSAEVEANRTAGRCLTATRQEIRDKFYTVLDNIRRTERLSTTWRDNLIAEFQEASYETRVIPYLDGTIASCDTVVIDHGFNDMMAIYNECVQHANTAKDETSYWPDDVAASMGLPPGIAYPTPDGVKGWHWLTNLSTGRDYNAETFMNTIYTTALGLMDGYADTTFRYEYFGAFMFLIAKIMKVNPRARIVIGNYFSQNCGDFIDSRSSWLTKYVLEANQQLANWLGYLCVNTYKYTGLRNRLIVKPDGTQVYDMYLFCPADGVHPSTDTTGESNRLLAGIYINALRGLFFK